jgi:hypothetical protein
MCQGIFRWIGHILRRNCLLQRVTEGKIQGGIEVTGRQGRRRRKLLDNPKERRRYSHLKEKALDRTMWRARFGRGFGPVVRQTTKCWFRTWCYQCICTINQSSNVHVRRLRYCRITHPYFTKKLTLTEKLSPEVYNRLSSLICKYFNIIVH